jgi:hypothetical protein
LPPVDIGNGTWKYVLLQADDGTGAPVTLVRSTAGLKYHAEMAQRSINDELEGMKVSVLGGGRIVNDGSGRISVYGYSKTYGRCSACNERAAALIRAAYPGLTVTWTNEGY